MSSWNPDAEVTPPHDALGRAYRLVPPPGTWMNVRHHLRLDPDFRAYTARDVARIVWREALFSFAVGAIWATCVVGILVLLGVFR